MDDDQYGIPDLRRLVPSGHHFPATSHSPEPFSLQRNLNLGDNLLPPSAHPFSPIIHHAIPYINTQYSPPQGIGFATGTDPSSSPVPMTSSAATSPLCRMEMDYCGDRLMESGSSSSRWPRQETLTLLEIRSRLDSKFKEANHKGPLWDEVSRIMSEEHGYHRSGKKCREKFENLYKYYKKTKEGKAGRQDGKNYRFFRQLEAIYGESASSSNNQVREAKNYNLHDQDKLCNKSISFSISNSSHDQLETSSSENNEEYDLSAMAFAMSHSMDKLEKDKKKIQRFDDDCQATKRSRRLGWREKLKAFVDLQMRKLVEGQEAWMGNILKTVEQREQERAWREIEWRKQEAARLDREHELWARERAWMEARDAALMEALKKSSLGYEQLINVNLSLSKTQLLSEREHNRAEDNTSESETWNLIQLRTSLDSSFQECGYSNDELWEVIAAKMTCLGHNLSGVECKERWENIRASFSKVADVNRKVE